MQLFLANFETVFFESDVEDVEPCVHLVESLRTFLSEKEAIISERAVRDLLQL